MSTQEELVRTHLPLARHLVTEALLRLPSHVLRDDLLSAAGMALTKAARDFEPERGVPFRAYAARRIRGALLDELRQADWATRQVRARVRRRDAASDELAAGLGRLPTQAELAAHLGVGEEELRALDEDVHRSVVLSLAPAVESGAVDRIIGGHAPDPEDVLLAREREAYLRDAVAVLPERLRRVVRGLFFEERTAAEVAGELAVTESRVSQMRAEALALVRDAVNSALEPTALTPADRPAGVAARRRAAYYAAVAAKSDYRARLSLPAPRPGAEAPARTA